MAPSRLISVVYSLVESWQNAIWIEVGGYKKPVGSQSQFEFLLGVWHMPYGERYPC